MAKFTRKQIREAKPAFVKPQIQPANTLSTETHQQLFRRLDLASQGLVFAHGPQQRKVKRQS